MSSGKILWVDDEIQLLKPHMLFLEKKNYEVIPCTNGADAVESVSEEQFDSRVTGVAGACRSNV